MKERMINGYSVRKVTYQTLPIAYRIQKESFKQLFEQYQDTETSPIWKRMRISLKVPTRE